MNVNTFPKWEKEKAYAKYEFVRLFNNAYYSILDVPENTDISNRKYWVLVVAEGVPVNHEYLQYEQIDRAIEGGGGGGGIRLLPSTGQSTTDGMTQKAITDAINNIPSSGGVVLQPTTGQSAIDGMTQKAITDELNGKAAQSDLDNTDQALADIDATVAALENVVQNKANESDVAALGNTVGILDNSVTQLNNQMQGKQDLLESAVNIKTINGESILGSGNLDIGGGGSSIVLEATTGQSTVNGMTQKAITDELNNKASNDLVEQINAEVQGKASALELQNLADVVNTKASMASLDALSATVQTKADQTSLDTLSASVQTKADQTSLDALSATVQTKADQTSLDALDLVVEGKADKSSVNNLELLLQNKQNQLIAGNNITLEPQTDDTVLISASGGSGSDNIFIIAYGVTTYAEIKAASDNDNLIVIKNVPSLANFVLCGFTQVTASKVTMYGLVNREITFEISVTSDDAWTSNITDLQVRLESGGNIKTINNNSILGSGNLTVSDGALTPSNDNDKFKYIQHSDGRIEIFWLDNTYPITISAGSGTMYRSENLSVPFPEDIQTLLSGLSCIYGNVATGKDSYSVNASLTSVPVATRFTFMAMSGSSRNNTNYVINGYFVFAA